MEIPPSYIIFVVMNHRVNCTTCNKEYYITKKHYSKAKSRKQTNFYCSNECNYRPIEERFWSKVNKADNKEDCWEWIASCRGKFGYGSISYKKKHIDAHRLSWILHNGEIESSKIFVCHKCDNPKCVNPHHLFLGSHSDNMKDAYDKGRLKVPEGIKFKKGHKAFNARITKEKAQSLRFDIRNRHWFNKTLQNIADENNLPLSLIKDISAGRVYN